MIIEWEQSVILQNKLSLEDLLPIDKMKLKHAVAIINVAIELKASTNPVVSALGVFLHHLKAFYLTFHDNDKDMNIR